MLQDLIFIFAADGRVIGPERLTGTWGSAFPHSLYLNREHIIDSQLTLATTERVSH